MDTLSASVRSHPARGRLGLACLVIAIIMVVTLPLLWTRGGVLAFWFLTLLGGVLFGRVVSSRLFTYGSVVAVGVVLMVALGPDAGQPPESAIEMAVNSLLGTIVFVAACCASLGVLFGHWLRGDRAATHESSEGTRCDPAGSSTLPHHDHPRP